MTAIDHAKSYRALDSGLRLFQRGYAFSLERVIRASNLLNNLLGRAVVSNLKYMNQLLQSNDQFAANTLLKVEVVSSPNCNNPMTKLS